MNPSFAAVSSFFIVFGKSPKVHKPAECTLDYPPSREHDEAFDIIASSDYLQDPATKNCNPLDKLACITTIGPDKPKTWEDSQQLHKDKLGTVSILDTGTMNDNGKQETQCIYRNVSLTAFDLLACVKPVVPPFCVVFTD